MLPVAKAHAMAHGELRRACEGPRIGMIDGDADGLALGSQAYDAALACSFAHREQVAHLESRADNDGNCLPHVMSDAVKNRGVVNEK